MMEGLYDKQSEIYEAVSKLLINFKKDGAERKTAEYCQQRLERLETLWLSFKSNHQKLERIGVSDDAYFVRNEYDNMREVYNTAKDVIQRIYEEKVRKEKAVAGGAALGPSSEESRSRTTESRN